jgi:hypothetical protein
VFIQAATLVLAMRSHGDGLTTFPFPVLYFQISLGSLLSPVTQAARPAQVRALAPARVQATNSRSQLRSGCRSAVHCGLSSWRGWFSLCIDAMMKYEFQRTNSESFHTVSPNERHIPSLFKPDFCNEMLLFRRFTNLVVVCYKMNFVVIVVVSVVTLRRGHGMLTADIR